MLPTASKTDAPGQAAGYLFQPERALYWLSASFLGQKVGIETGDDIVIKDKFSFILEQAKHTIDPQKNPLYDTSIAFWKSLFNWCKGVTEGLVEIDKVNFLLVTNAILPECLAKRVGNATSPGDATKIISEFQKIWLNPPDSITPFVSLIKTVPHQVLNKIIVRIDVVDGSQDSYGADLKGKIASQLRLSSDIPHDEIIQGLLGWIHETVLDLWRKGEPAWISSESFFNQFHRLRDYFRGLRFTETAKYLLKVSQEERIPLIKNIFVKQLELLGEGQDANLISNCIDDYIRAKSELTRLAKEGNITKGDLEAFKGRLIERWDLIFNRLLRQNRNTLHVSDEIIGQDILDTTLDHREILAGRQTEEYYLTKGSYHHLADSQSVGWHPNFRNLL